MFAALLPHHTLLSLRNHCDARVSSFCSCQALQQGTTRRCSNAPTELLKVADFGFRNHVFVATESRPGWEFCQSSKVTLSLRSFQGIASCGKVARFKSWALRGGGDGTWALHSFSSRVLRCLIWWAGSSPPTISDSSRARALAASGSLLYCRITSSRSLPCPSPSCKLILMASLFGRGGGQWGKEGCPLPLYP